MSDTPTTPEQEPQRPTDSLTPPRPATRAEARAAQSPLAPVAPADPRGEASFDTSTTLDEGTYTQLRKPRSAAGLDLDGTWHQISPKYLVSQLVQEVIFVAIVVAAAIVVTIVVPDLTWVWLVAGGLIVISLIPLVVLPRQVKALGYMLREDDIVFRKGILWQRLVAVPYGRLQLVDVSSGPMDRAFGIAKLKMVTAAATTGVEIPGLPKAASEALRDALIEVAEERRTGL